MVTSARRSPRHAGWCAAAREFHPAATIRICLLLVAVAGAWCLASATSAQVRLPDFGDASEQVLSPAQERVLGEAFMREVRSRLVVVDDPLVEQYVRSLGYRLVASSDRRDLEFTFFVVADESLNAFAAPGGFIGVNAGMILATRSESELASVFAHEIAHVTQRHIARAIDHAGRSNIPVLAGILAAIVIGTQNVEAGQATAAAVIGASAQRQINFTRQNEMEADRVGIRMLADAGFDPREMAGVFEKLQNTARFSQHPPEFLSTHPVTTNRIAEARERADRLDYRQHESSESYYLVRAALRARIVRDPQRVLDEFIEELASGTAQSVTANSYGQALAMIRLGREDHARAVLESLVDSSPDNMAFRAVLAASERRRGNLERALSLYAEGLDLYPGDRLLSGGYAVTLTEAGRPDETLKLIDDYERRNAMDPEMFRLRADAYGQLGRMLESRADLAEHFYLNGQLVRAIHQLRLAMQEPERNFYRISRIEARLEELEGELALRRIQR